MEKQKEKRSFSQWLKTSITIRMLMVGILILVLLIPLSYIKNLIQERSYRQKEVVSEIHQKWGEQVSIYGPILKVPYQIHHRNKMWNEKTKSYDISDDIETQYAYFFPNLLDINGHIASETKGRNIYESVVYKSDMMIQGNFGIPDFAQRDIPQEDILWDKATIIINSSNLKGIRSNLNFEINDHSYPMRSVYSGNKNVKIISTSTLNQNSLPIENSVSFALHLKINGSKQLRFVPIGKETQVQLSSNWNSPSFNGQFLPEEKEITTDGFRAKWTILDLNRDFEQSFFETLPELSHNTFGIKLLIPVDEYQKNERAAKYGYLVITLTFLIFFLIQTISKINIHPFQYLMIGLALTMFYTLLISISEHACFLKAYLIAGISVILLITVYTKAVLKSIKFMIFIATSLLALYTFIFVIIQLENYALLVGSIGLFIILGSIMMISRKIDWQNAL